jgi:hypothetical protein
MKPTKRINWDNQPLGKVSDVQLANRLGVTRQTIANQRDKRGILPYRRHHADEYPMVDLSEHHIHITTGIKNRCSIYRMPESYRLMWSFKQGWRLIDTQGTSNASKWYTIAGEYEEDSDKWIVIDIKGIIVCDSRTTE